MVKKVKADNIGVCLGLLLAMVLVVIVGGCSSPASPSSPPSDLGKPVNTEVDVAVQILDVANNTPVLNVPVYFISCSPRVNDTRDIHKTNLTGEDGWARFSVNYTLAEGDILYLGASGIKPLVEADLAAGAFNGSGYLGMWQSFNYGMVNSSNNDGVAYIAGAMTVDRDTGKII
jgi:hypothetical protein